MAVAHSQLCVCWELLKNGQAYQDLGPQYFEKLNEDRTKRDPIHRLEKFGYTVTLQKQEAA
jgi:transposase